MAALAIEVQDMARVHSLLVVPSPRRIPTSKEMAAFVSRLAPIEMAAPSLTACMSSSSKQHAILPAHQHHHHQADPQAGSQTSCSGPAVTVQGWAIPLAYAGCGMLLCLCNILVPDGIVACAHVLAPAWTLTLALHALASNDPVWLWLGALVALLLPFVLLLRDPLFACFYLLAFAGFGSGRFWHTLQGPAFILACVSWFGLATGCVMTVLADQPRAQLSVAAFFALASAIVTSAARFGKLVLRLGSGTF